MGRRGPAPKPAEVLRMRGSRGADKAGGRPKPIPQPPACPRWLDKEARAKWKELVPELSRLGLLTVVDGPSLACFCEAWSTFRRACETLAKEGETFTTPKGYIAVHPMVAIRNASRHAIRLFGAPFGLDPGSRTRLEMPPDVDDEGEDEFEQFLNQGRDRQKG